MRIRDEFRKCVCFLALRKDNGDYCFVGSAFWLGRDIPGESRTKQTYLVTARHVIESIRKKGLTEVWLRVNHKDGTARWYSIDLDRWFIYYADMSIDVAVVSAGIPEELDHLVFPWSLCITPARWRENEVSLGEEVFVVGLFSNHYGRERNIPVVRVGNLAAIGEEKVVTQYGLMDALLIEARSTGGLSGSPVFLNLGDFRRIGGETKFASSEVQYCLGLVHGHFPVRDAADTAGEIHADVVSSIARLNTGIAVVVPFHSVEKVVEAYEALTGTAVESQAPGAKLPQAEHLDEDTPQ